MNENVKYYSLAVEFPNVSGAEHLEMLMIRDHLEAQKGSLTAEEQKCLVEADRKLITQADTFNRELKGIPEQERHWRQVPPSHWWWYLDVLAHLPVLQTEKQAQVTQLEEAVLA